MSYVQCHSIKLLVTGKNKVSLACCWNLLNVNHGSLNSWWISWSFVNKWSISKFGLFFCRLSSVSNLFRVKPVVIRTLILFQGRYNEVEIQFFYFVQIIWLVDIEHAILELLLWNTVLAYLVSSLQCIFLGWLLL